MRDKPVKLICMSVHDNEFSKLKRVMLQHTDPMFSQGFKKRYFPTSWKISLVHKSLTFADGRGKALSNDFGFCFIG